MKFYLFNNEAFLDYKNFTEPIKYNTRVVKQISSVFNSEAGGFTHGHMYTINLQANEATTIDFPWQNPFVEERGVQKEYLNFNSIVQGPEAKRLIFGLNLQLADTKQLRQRQVYSFIELVSEVSGFADVLFITAGVFFGSFYTPRLQRAKLIEETSLI